jgi:hypothetical protein
MITDYELGRTSKESVFNNDTMQTMSEENHDKIQSE